MLLWGIRRMGALPIDVDVRGGADQILKFAQLTKPVCLATTPSLAEFLIKRTPQSLGVGVGDLGFKSLLLCGEPGPGIPEVKKRLESAYEARVYDYWAPGGLGYGMSCDSDDYHGLHCYAPDYNTFQDDLVDPFTKEPIDIVDGVEGELVHTSLERDATPMIRYAYGDIVKVITHECPGCGFKGKRLKFVGRSDDMVIVKGTNIYPASIQEIVASLYPRTTGLIKLVLDEPPPRVVPPLKVKVEQGKDVTADQLEALAAEIKNLCKAKLKINPEIIFVPSGGFETTLRKREIFEKTYL